METLQTTLEMINIHSDNESDEIDAEFEASLLRGDDSDGEKSVESSKNLDDRLFEIEFGELQERIDDLVSHKIPFGTSGLLSSAVAYKNLDSNEIKQLKQNAIQISSLVNAVKDRLANPDYMGLATLSLITDDLYQAGFQNDVKCNLHFNNFYI